MSDRERQGETFILLEALLWSLFPIITILSYANLSPMVSLGWSTIFGGVFFAIMLSFRHRWHEVKNLAALKDILWGTFLIGILYYVFLFWGLKFTSAGNVSIIALMEVFFTYLFFNVWRREYISWKHILGIALMITGALIVLYPNFSEFHPGDLLVLIGTTFAPFGNLFQKRAREKVSSETIMFTRSMIAGPFILLLAYVFGFHFSATQLKGSLLFLFVNGFLLLGLSKILWIEGIYRISVTKAQALTNISPLLTVFFAWLILYDQPTIWQLSAFFPMFLAVILLSSNSETVRNAIV